MMNPMKVMWSTYKVNSYIDFKPYKKTFKQFGQYMVRFLKDIHDPHYVGNYTIYIDQKGVHQSN